jgi:superfamily II DNA or RNA helicase
LGYKAIVIVHKDFLMTQWYDRIKEFIPQAKIGKIQQNTIDIENKDIVLSMVQSLSMKEYPKDTFSSFGLAIFDECHHLGAEVFQKCMSKVQTKYMLGLSATPNRKDGCKKVFEWYIGKLAYVSKEKNTDYVQVDILKYLIEDETYCKVEKVYTGRGPQACCPKMINNICDYKPRTIIVIDKIIEYYNEGRDILYLSDRRNNLKEIHEILKKNKIDSGYYVGGMKPEQLRDAQEKRIILGTFSMASEGMDIPKLNTIILGSPKSDIVQSVGRILRQTKDKRKFHPLIFDINDEFSIFKNQSKKRLTFYSKQNYDINIIENGILTKYEKNKKKKNINLNVCLID